jgi:Tol biopolymer transport system component/DNA-binding winged helix-turn-helix (wHTH) protein
MPAELDCPGRIWLDLPGECPSCESIARRSRPTAVIAPGEPFTLSGFRVEPATGTLESESAVQHLPPRLMDLLCLLAAAPNRTVDRDDLVAALWPRGHVNEDALSRAVAELRRHLGDDARNPRFIETLPKRGYRLLVPVEPLPGPGRAAGAARRWAAPALAGGLGLLVAALFLTWSRPQPPIHPVLLASATLLTADPVMKYQPQLSPDGRLLAYTEWFEDRMALMLLPIDQPTKKYRLDSEDSVWSPVFAPDSRNLAVALTGATGCRVHRWSVTGGEPEPLGPCVIPNESAILDWSADGRYLAYVDRDPATGSGAIWRLSLAEGTGIKLTSPPDGYSFDTRPRFSPDGRWLSFSRGTRAAREIWVLDLREVGEGNSPLPEPRQLSFDHQFTIGHQWMDDGRTLVLDSERSGYRALWTLDLDGNWNLLGARDAESPTRAGNHLAFKVSQFESNIWTVDLATGKPGDQPLLASNKYDSNPALSPDGTRIAFTSNRTGRGSIWLADRDGGNQRLVYEPASGRVVAPAWAPDGGHLVATQYQAGGQHLVRVTVGDGLSAMIPTAGKRPYNGTYSADGAWLYYVATAGIEGNRLWRQPGDGSMPGEIVVDQPVSAFRLVAGQGIFYTKHAQEGLYLAPFDEPERETRIIPDLVASNWGDWLVTDGWVIYLSADENGTTHLMKRPIEGGEAEWVSDFYPTAMWPNLAVIPETNTLLVARTDRAQADLYLFELER